MNDFNDINSNILHDLIQSSYQRNNTAEDIGLKHGYRLDHNLSNSEHKVFSNPDKQDSTIVFTGSRKAGDWLITDPAIALGLGKYTPRFKASEEVIQKAKEKNGSNNVNTIGHSLGGWLVENTSGNKKYTVNKASTLSDVGKTIKKNQTDIIVNGDIFAPLTRSQKHKGKLIRIKNNGYNPLDAHDYKHLRKINI